MRRKIEVRTIEEADVSVEELYELRMAAFQQWTNAGLYTSAAYTPKERFARSLTNKTVFVAQDETTGELLAMRSLVLDKNKGCAAESDLSVSPSAKRQGIGTLLFETEVEWLIKSGYRYITCLTAIPAIWSVRWHLKNGYHIVGYKRSEKHNYGLYVFRKQIDTDVWHHPADLLWTRPIEPVTTKVWYAASYIATSLCKTRTGRLNWIGRVAKKILKR